MVNARVPGKSNTKKNLRHPKRNHMAMAQMSAMQEVGVEFQDIVDVWSVDDKAKLLVSAHCTTVSRHHQNHKFFMKGDGPNCYDHDFGGGQGYKLVPSGYLRLLQELWQKYARYYDAHGRAHLPKSREGEMHVVLRAQLYQKSNAASHARDLHRLLADVEDPKPIVMLYADGGPDWAIDSFNTVYYYGCLWMKVGLDVLSLGSGGGGNSAHNPVERKWSDFIDPGKPPRYVTKGPQMFCW